MGNAIRHLMCFKAIDNIDHKHNLQSIYHFFLLTSLAFSK